MSTRPQPKLEKASYYLSRLGVVGMEGFEPPTSCSQSRRATRLRYIPIFHHPRRYRLVRLKRGIYYYF